MRQESIILYLEANSITVEGNVDQYFRLSPNSIKSWTNSAPQPTEADLSPYETQIKAEKDAVAYQAKRAAEYPPIGDQLDALFKAGVFPQEMTDQIQAVKTKHPKP
jgi:hypothetical protein